ncbi:hypothetical protein C8F04DRAFT_1268590 [Mycena alexandri]|uniref:Uncharacterized protein n=1 Tax=Mycena alexandri TaxID=1745969 RepID=A0AAD6SEZ5_9AGAR|nr:hypothetical protein C8F04DRAFT_1268590 [Mycena alexandri]
MLYFSALAYYDPQHTELTLAFTADMNSSYCDEVHALRVDTGVKVINELAPLQPCSERLSIAYMKSEQHISINLKESLKTLARSALHLLALVNLTHEIHGAATQRPVRRHQFVLVVGSEGPDTPDSGDRSTSLRWAVHAHARVPSPQGRPRSTRVAPSFPRKQADPKNVKPQSLNLPRGADAAIMPSALRKAIPAFCRRAQAFVPWENFVTPQPGRTPHVPGLNSSIHEWQYERKYLFDDQVLPNASIIVVIPDSGPSTTLVSRGKGEVLNHDTSGNEGSISSVDAIPFPLTSPSSLLALNSSSSIDTTPSASLSIGSSSSLVQSFPRPRVSSGVAVAYFSPIIAERRATIDHALIGRLLENFASGFYRKHPEKHELRKTPIPESLLRYQPSTSRTRLADLMQNMTSPVGRIISEFTSTAGIPRTTFLLLLKESILYGRCTGSVNLPLGASHLVSSQFSLRSKPHPVSKCLDPSPREVPFLRFRTYPAGVEIPPIQDFLNTPIGRAFVEWNGRIGIPQDVWYTIMTAYVHCRSGVDPDTIHNLNYSTRLRACVKVQFTPDPCPKLKL